MTLVIGLDVGGTNVRGIGLRPDGTFGQIIKLPHTGGPAEIVSTIAAVVDELAKAEALPVAAVGVGCAGKVGLDGVVRGSPNIGALVEFPLKEWLDQQLGMDTLVDNDANVAAVAEARIGAAQGAQNMALVTLGTGVGVGLVIDGMLRRGAYGFAGEAGHMTISHQGILCVCGRRGCWERYASGSALSRMALEAAQAGKAPALVAAAGGDANAVRAEDVGPLAAANDPGATEIMAELGYWTAVGVANLVNLVDPEVVVIGGGLAEIGQPLLSVIEAGYNNVMVDKDRRGQLSFRLAHFGERSGVVGAALLAKDRAP